MDRSQKKFEQNNKTHNTEKIIRCEVKSAEKKEFLNSLKFSVARRDLENHFAKRFHFSS
jgi:hypothetical protein